ncbi:MAG TPA: c-type cytochrome [Gaiellaceae bacterium]|nr:c-type cytochrome [Gaiellaceae bacterium]
MTAAALLAALVLAAPAPASEGRALYEEGCVECHGLSREGVDGIGPSLQNVSQGTVDFYLSTGRMPLDKPGNQPLRRKPIYPPEQIAALVAYLGSDEPIPHPDPARGDVARGFKLYTEWCAGCHQVVARGGAMPRALIPPLLEATPTQIAEAVRSGPWAMPRFDAEQLDDRQLNDVIRYILYARDPDDRGGWSLGNVGPIPEGMVAWLLAGIALVLVARVIGKRLER